MQLEKSGVAVQRNSSTWSPACNSLSQTPVVEGLPLSHSVQYSLNDAGLTPPIESTA